MKKTLLEKFEDAEMIHSAKAELNLSSKTELTEEMVIWQRAERVSANPISDLRKNVAALTALKEKDVSLRIKRGVAYESWSFKKVNSMFIDKNFVNFFSGENDYCNLNISLEENSFNIEAYRMIEVTNRYREKVSAELIERMREAYGKNFQMIKRDYGKNEYGVSVLILGFHYRVNNKTAEKFKEGFRA